MLSAEYHLKQAEVAARLALAERDPAKAARFRLLVLEQFEKAKEIDANELILALADEAQPQFSMSRSVFAAAVRSVPSDHDD
jgi:hypothetical protein